MRILISIATYGTKNINYLNRVLDEYKSYTNYDIDIYVHGTHDISRDHIKFIKYENPKNTVFLHRSEFVEKQNEYDYYLFTEDDILIKESAISTYLKYDCNLPVNACIGFIRFENTLENTKYFIDLWKNISGYNYIKNKNIQINNIDYFSVTNPHQACYFLSKEKLKHVINNSNYLIDGAGLGLETASSGIFTDWYLGTGVINKLLPMNEEDLENCSIEHLPGNHCNPPGVNSSPEVFRSNTITMNELLSDLKMK